MNVFESVAFPVFAAAFCIGIFWGFIIHGLVRAPRWLVDALSQ